MSTFFKRNSEEKSGPITRLHRGVKVLLTSMSTYMLCKKKSQLALKKRSTVLHNRVPTPGVPCNCRVGVGTRYSFFGPKWNYGCKIFICLGGIGRGGPPLPRPLFLYLYEGYLFEDRMPFRPSNMWVCVCVCPRLTSDCVPYPAKPQGELTGGGAVWPIEIQGPSKGIHTSPPPR